MVSLNRVNILGGVTFSISDIELNYLVDFNLPQIDTVNIYSRGEIYYKRFSSYEILEKITSTIKIYNSSSCLNTKYILIDHLFNFVIRLLDVLISSKCYEFTNQYIESAIVCSKNIISYIERGSIQSKIEIKTPFVSNLYNSYPRIYLEGDNHFISLLAVKEFRKYDVCVGVLLGGGAPAAIYSAYHDAKLNYIKISCYDEKASSSYEVFGDDINKTQNVLLLDDNCGTGKTLFRGRQLLLDKFGIEACLGAVELHWDKVLRVKGYKHTGDIFDYNDLDEISFWSVRHHNLLAQLTNIPPTGNTTVEIWKYYSYSILRLLSDLDSSFNLVIASKLK